MKRDPKILECSACGSRENENEVTLQLNETVALNSVQRWMLEEVRVASASQQYNWLFPTWTFYPAKSNKNKDLQTFNGVKSPPMYLFCVSFLRPWGCTSGKWTKKGDTEIQETVALTQKSSKGKHLEVTTVSADWEGSHSQIGSDCGERGGEAFWERGC